MAQRINEPAVPQWLSITGEKLDLGFPNGLLGKCSSISSFEKLNQLGEGTYGVVYRARDTRNAKVVALKQVRILPHERQNGIPITAIREIAILQSLKHTNIINVFDVAVGANDGTDNEEGEALSSSRIGDGQSLERVFMVMEYAEQDLANLLDHVHVKYTLSETKCLFRQLLKGLDYLHRNDIIHRDVKMSNLLLTSQGILKIADFGMAREYSPRPLTPGVVTIWYRSPELLLGTSHYNPSVDLWSAGLILAELLLCAPLLPGDTEIQQLSLIVKLLGTPTPNDLAALSAMGCPELSQWRREQLPQGRVDNLERRFLSDTTKETVRFLGGLLRWDPDARWTALEALGKGRSRHAGEAERWWKESPREVGRELLPTFPEIRNGERVGGQMVLRGPNDGSLGNGKEKEGSGKSQGGNFETYVFDFADDPNGSQRAAKRHKAR